MVWKLILLKFKQLLTGLQPTQQNLRSFLGLASYYRRFIPKFAEIAAPLYRLQERNLVSAGLNLARQPSYLKQKLTLLLCWHSLLVTACLLDTDASDIAIGAVLLNCRVAWRRLLHMVAGHFPSLRGNFVLPGGSF